MSAAAAVGGGFLASLGQFFASPWVLVPVAVAVLMLAGRWYAGRRTRVTHLVILPPGGEIGDDVIAMVKQWRGDAWAEALERLVREEEHRG